MRGHIHTDFIHALWAVLVVGIGFHALRGLGAFLASHGAEGVGNFVGGFATFPGAGM